MYYFWLKKFLLSAAFPRIHIAIFCYTNTIVFETGLKRITEMIKKRRPLGKINRSLLQRKTLNSFKH